MKKEEYKSKLKEIEDNAELQKINLAKVYALSNNPVKKGDILTDKAGTILKVERIQFTHSFLGDMSDCVYSGTELTRKYTEKKRQTGIKIYQINIVKHEKNGNK